MRNAGKTRNIAKRGSCVTVRLEHVVTGRNAPSEFQNKNLYHSEKIVSASSLEHCTCEVIKLGLEKNADFALIQSVYLANFTVSPCILIH